MAVKVGLLCLFLYLSCERSSGNVKTSEQEAQQDENEQSQTEPQEQNDININLYIENSGSMDGYIRGNSDFKNMLFNFLPDIRHFYKSVNFRLINEKVYPSETKDVQEFVNNLNPVSDYYLQGNRSYSNMNDIINRILKSSSGDSLSIFLSDCMYAKGKNPKSNLTAQMGLIKDHFLTQIKNNSTLSVIVVRLTSSFNGAYYYYNETAEAYAQKYISPKRNIERPYFMWIAGRSEVLKHFLNRIKIENLHKFTNMLPIINYEVTTINDVPFSVLLSTAKIGRFDQNNDCGRELVKGIEDIELSSRKTFTMAVALDLSKLGATPHFISDPSNYKITAGWKIDSIQSIGEEFLETIENNADRKRIEKVKATHNFILSIDGSSIGIAARSAKLQIKLRNPSQYELPEWVRQFSTTNSKDLVDAMQRGYNTSITTEMQKTFGIEYLIRGVVNAYNTKGSDEQAEYHFALEIPVTFD